MILLFVEVWDRVVLVGNEDLYFYVEVEGLMINAKFEVLFAI